VNFHSKFLATFELQWCFPCVLWHISNLSQVQRGHRLCWSPTLQCICFEISIFHFEDFQLLASVTSFSLQNTDKICRPSWEQGLNHKHVLHFLLNLKCLNLICVWHNDHQLCGSDSALFYVLVHCLLQSCWLHYQYWYQSAGWKIANQNTCISFLFQWHPNSHLQLHC